MANISNYSYWNKWAVPIWYSKDPDYDDIRNDAITECLQFHTDNKNRTEVAHGLIYMNLSLIFFRSQDLKIINL
jgi:hypothetical protein